MAFDESVVTSVSIMPSDGDLLVTWKSTATFGTWYQVYVNRVLAAETQSLRMFLPYPGGSRITVDVGAVAVTDLGTDLSGSLPSLSGGGDRALLSWVGGTYLATHGDGDVKGFRVFGSDSAGGAVDYSVVLADLAAYSQDRPIDGFGLGGFGLGGFGLADSLYSWKSGHLTRGVWSFAIKAYDHAGNLGGAATTSVTITGPPQPPAPNSAGQRLTYTYNATLHKITLNWLNSPG